MDQGSAYLWVKALHLIAVIAWMAGLLYLPRLFVYHAQAKPGSETSETLKVMERRLLTAIMTPAMIAAWILGLLLVFWFDAISWAHDEWFHAKFALVVILSAYQGLCRRWQKDFAADRNTRPPRFYRIVNEVPTVIMILVVILVIVRPF